MKTLKVCAAFVMFTLSVYPSISKAAEPNSFPICKWSEEQSCPAVSGSYVVWQDKRSGLYDIYRNNPVDMNDVNGIMICQQPRDQKLSAVSGSMVVWQDARISTSNTDIFRYSLPLGPEAEVCTYTGKQEAPAISGNIIVWQDFRNGNNDIFGYDGSEFEICTDTVSQSNPAVSGNMVVWQDARNGNMDIYGKNLDMLEEFVVCTDANTQQSPAISGNIVVWQDYRHGETNADIYGKNLSSGEEFIICSAADQQIAPAIGGDIVVWEDRRSGTGDIYGYRISSRMAFPICTNSYDQKNPAIDGNFVVWEDYRNANADIYGAYIPEPVAPSTITVLNPNGGEMLLAGSQYTIRWESSGLGSSNVKLEYSTDNGAGYLLIDANFPSSGSYFWQPLPAVDSNQCLIKISDKDGEIASDTSNHVFTIFECDKSLTADLSGDCKVNLTDFALFSGQWLTCGNPHDPNWCP